MKVYLVICDDDEYYPPLKSVEKVFATKKAANAYKKQRDKEEENSWEIKNFYVESHNVI